MIKSVRIDEELAHRLERAARELNLSASAFIREAVSRRCREVLEGSLAERLESVIGAIESDGGRAESTGRAYSELLRSKRETGC